MLWDIFRDILTLLFYPHSEKAVGIGSNFNQHKFEVNKWPLFFKKKLSRLQRVISKVRFWVEYLFEVVNLWVFIPSSMQHLTDHMHEWCPSTACRYTRTVNSQTRILSTYNVQSKSLNMNKERKKKCLINLPKKKSRTDIFHNLLNLDSLKDIQLLHSWSVLGYFFFSCLYTYKYWFI